MVSGAHGAVDLSANASQQAQDRQMAEVRLYPDEQNRVMILWADLSRKHSKKLDSDKALENFAEETVQRFASEVGLRVHVETDNWEMTEHGLIRSPQISIMGRIEPEQEFDHDRMRVEVQEGLVDGVPGVIKEDGRFTDRSRPL